MPSGIPNGFLAGLVGFLTLTLHSTLLLFLGQLNIGSFSLGLLLIAGVSVTILLTTRRSEFTPGGGLHPGPGPIMEKITALIVLAVLIHTFLGSLTPEVRSDPLRYHLRLAQQYALRGGIEPLRENPWWAIPQYAESVYSVGILWWNDTLAKLFHWTAGLVVVLGIFGFTRLRFDRSAACWAVLLWVLTPKVSYEMTTTYVEMILTLWVFASILFGYKSLCEEETGRAGLYLVFSGFFLGMAFGTKYTAFAVQGLPWFLFPIAFLWVKRSDLSPRFLWVVLSGAALTIADSPWLVRNTLLTGNPIYPLYNHLFGLHSEVDRGIETFFLTVWPGESLLGLRFYYERILGLFHSGYHFFPLALLLPLFLFLMRDKERERRMFPIPDKILLAFCALSFAAYLIFTGNMDGRFYLPTLSILICYLGAGLHRFLTLLPLSASTLAVVRILFVALLAYNYLGQRHAFYLHFKESPLPILSEEARWDYYLSQGVGEPEGVLWEEVIPRDAYVYGMGFPYRLKALHPLDEGVYDETTNPPQRLKTSVNPLIDAFQQSERTPDAFREIAKSVGIDYLLVPKGEYPDKERFWDTAKTAFKSVEGTNGRLLKVD